MLRHVLFLFFLYGIKLCSSSTGGEAQEQTIDTKDVSQNGIKKNGLGANGFEPNWEKVLGNFRNPVLEYLLHSNADRANAPPKRGGVIREIRHSQTLLMPSPLGAPLPPLFTNQLPQFEPLKTPGGEGTRNPDRSPVDNFWNDLKNKTQSGGNKTYESVVTSPVLHLSKEGEESREETRIQTYPAVAVVINTFDKGGALKKSVTHFQPDFNSLAPVRGASHVTVGSNANEIKNKVDGNQDRVKNPGDGGGSGFPGGSSRQGLQWPLAGYFPIVINDPFLSVYNAFATSMYNAVSSMVEYGPAADVCSREGEKGEGLEGVRERSPVVGGEAEGDVFGEVTMRSEKLRRIEGRPLKGVERRKRDATSILVKSREGDVVNITLEEPADVNDVFASSQDERARSFSQTLVNTPPLSTILRPPQQGFADKKRRTKPTKPAKEEGNSEEVGEEQEEESTSQSQESANEAVAISPPPEGASVAEAKPIGLAIAGPGGVAASKPQGTAVAGPGGLAIARPVGTAIAGVDVEGSVPIGGQQKNKKKPKQEQEQTEGELHYVGGLTGPIGNPQPKEFADSVYYKTVKDTEGNNIQENLFRGVPNGNGYQLRLGLQNGKYGFLPAFASPAEGESRLQKRTDFPTFFHGLLGNTAQGYEQFPKYETQF